MSYRAYNVFCLTFRRNLWVLIKRKILRATSRKNRGPAKSRRTNGNKTEGYRAGRQEVKKLKVKGYAWPAVHMSCMITKKVEKKHGWSCTFARSCIWRRKFTADMHGW